MDRLKALLSKIQRHDHREPVELDGNAVRRVQKDTRALEGRLDFLIQRQRDNIIEERFLNSRKRLQS